MTSSEMNHDNPEVDLISDADVDISGSDNESTIDTTVVTNTLDEPSFLGYTPLDDVGFNGTEMIMMTTGVGDTEEGTMFFCAPCESLMLFDQGQDSDEASDVAGTSDTTIENYEDLAMSALRQLEDEYCSTLTPSAITPASSLHHLNSIENSITLETDKNERSEVTGLISDVVQSHFTLSTSIVEKKQEETLEKINFTTGNSTEAQTIDNSRKLADTERILQAVQAIRLTSPKLTAGLDQGWETRIWDRIRLKEVQDQILTHHSIIPPIPLAAFSSKKRSLKALQASVKLSRSACLAESLSRLNLKTTNKPNILVVDIIGVDHVECNTTEALLGLFCPIARWLDNVSQKGGNDAISYQHLHLNLIGPNLPYNCENWPPLDLMPFKTTFPSSLGLRSASAVCRVGCYHEVCHMKPTDADLIIAYNAGIWGYDDWIPTLKYMIKLQTPTPFVVTAYTLEECQDDAEVIAKLVEASNGCLEDRNENCLAEMLWSPQENPFKSRIQRETTTAVGGRIYHENGAWQAWNMGGQTQNLNKN